MAIRFDWVAALLGIVTILDPLFLKKRLSEKSPFGLSALHMRVSTRAYVARQCSVKVAHTVHSSQGLVPLAVVM